MNCGNSSRLVFRRKEPKRVLRGSSDVVHWESLTDFGLARIVRNLYIRNGLPLSPTRSCTKNTGPGEVKRMISDTTPKIGAVRSKNAAEKQTSKARFNKA